MVTLCDECRNDHTVRAYLPPASSVNAQARALGPICDDRTRHHTSDGPRLVRLGTWHRALKYLTQSALAALADTLRRKGDVAGCRTAADGALNAIAYYESHKPRRADDGVIRRTSHWELEAGAIAPRMRGYLGR